MVKYVIKRVLLLIPMMLCIAFFVFLIMDMSPGDPAVIILGEGASEEALEAVREEYGLNDSLLVRFVTYIKNLLTGDFGKSWRTGREISDELWPKFFSTLKLSILGILAASLVGIPLGILSAVKQYSVLDSTCTVSAMFFAAVPPFWLGMLMILLFSLTLSWLPSFGLDSWKHYILPVAAISIPRASMILRFSRSSMLETIRMDYIRTARAKGLPEGTVIVKHALGNALLPIITVLGLNFGRLLGGIVVIEQVFAIPGMGMFALSAIKNKDIPQILGSVIILSIAFCVIILIVDIMYGFADPRTRSMYASVKKKKAL